MSAECIMGPKRKSSKPRNIKYNNQKLVLSLFRYAERISVSEIAEQAGLSKTTITKIVGDFLEKGLIVSAGKGESTEEGGKKPELFSFNPTYQYSLVVNLTRSCASIFLMDLTSHLIDQIQLRDSIVPEDYGGMVQLAARAIRDLLKNSGLDLSRISGIIVMGDGILDVKNGTIRYSVHHQWPRNLPICQDLARALQTDVPVYIENNSALVGYSDLLDPENQPFNTIVHLTVGAHTGGCVLKKHELVHGFNGFMGEFGHIIVDPHSNLTCMCGSKGCFEVMAAPRNVFRNAESWKDEYPDSPVTEALHNGDLTMQVIFDASNLGDTFACRLMDEVIRWFCVLIRTIMIANDPEKIIIGGEYQHAGRYFLETLRSMVASTPFFRTGADLPIAYAKDSREIAYLTGASYYLCRKYIDNDHLYD